MKQRMTDRTEMWIDRQRMQTKTGWARDEVEEEDDDGETTKKEKENGWGTVNWQTTGSVLAKTESAECAERGLAHSFCNSFTRDASLSRKNA